MKRLFLQSMVMLTVCFYSLLHAQSSFLTFSANRAEGGGIAGYCLGHETTHKQIKCGNVGNNRTWAHLHLASSDTVTGIAADYGLKLTGATGFQNFSNALIAAGFNWGDVKVRFSESSLLNDIQGVDYFYTGTRETRFYKGGTYRIYVGNVEIANGNMPVLQDKINYNDRVSCMDDAIRLISGYTQAPTPVAGNLLGETLWQEIGNRGIAFDFPVTGFNAIRGDFNRNCVDSAPQVPEKGAFFECNAGKILVSDYPYNNKNFVIAVNPDGNCVNAVNIVSNNSRQWLHVRNGAGAVICSILDDANMGTIRTSYQIISGSPVRFTVSRDYWLDRELTITPQVQPAKPIRVRFYFTSNEWNRYIAATLSDNLERNNAGYIGDLIATRVCKPAGCNELFNGDLGTFINAVDAGMYNNDGYYIDILTNYLSYFTFSTTKVLNNAANTVGFITSFPSVPDMVNCGLGINQQLNVSLAGGTWSSSNVAVATVNANSGIIRSVGNGTTNITYAYPTPGMTCKAESFGVYTVAKEASPIIRAAANFSCTIGGLVNVTTNVGNGVWSSSNNAAARIANINGLSANIQSIATGVSNINYTISSALGCSFPSNTIVFNVAPIAQPPAIVGANAVCANRTTLFTNATAGGTWTSGNVALATVNANGLVSGVAAGNNVAITYTVRNQFCSNNRVKNINVLAIPAVPVIQTLVPVNLLSICSQDRIPLKVIPAGGVWTSVNPAQVSVDHWLSFKNNGVGLGSITYTTAPNANGCTNSRAMVVNSIQCGPVAPFKTANNNANNNADAQLGTQAVGVYPNPVTKNGMVKISWPSIEDAVQIIITTNRGKEIAKQFVYRSNSCNFQLPQLPAGVYIVSILTNESKVVKKLVVE